MAADIGQQFRIVEESGSRIAGVRRRAEIRVALISIAPRYGAAVACELTGAPQIVRAPP